MISWQLSNDIRMVPLPEVQRVTMHPRAHTIVAQVVRANLARAAETGEEKEDCSTALARVTQA